MDLVGRPRRAVICVAVGVALLTGCVVRVREPYVEPETAFIIEEPPPPEKAEPVPPQPRAETFYVKGYWTQRKGEWVWVPGRWESHRHGYEWVPARWATASGLWGFVPGHWRAE